MAERKVLERLVFGNGLVLAGFPTQISDFKNKGEKYMESLGGIVGHSSYVGLPEVFVSLGLTPGTKNDYLLESLEAMGGLMVMPPQIEDPYEIPFKKEISSSLLMVPTMPEFPGESYESKKSSKYIPQMHQDSKSYHNKRFFEKGNNKFKKGRK